MVSEHQRPCTHQPLNPGSIKQASSGDDENVDDKDDPEVRSHFDRNAPFYPYKRSVMSSRITCICFENLRGVLTSMAVMDNG